MDEPQEFISYKKLLIFGAEKSGKSSLTKSLESLPFSEDCEQNDGNLYIYLILFFI